MRLWTGSVPGLALLGVDDCCSVVDASSSSEETEEEEDKRKISAGVT